MDEPKEEGEGGPEEGEASALGVPLDEEEEANELFVPLDAGRPGPLGGGQEPRLLADELLVPPVAGALMPVGELPMFV